MLALCFLFLCWFMGDHYSAPTAVAPLPHYWHVECDHCEESHFVPLTYDEWGQDVEWVEWTCPHPQCGLHQWCWTDELGRVWLDIAPHGLVRIRPIIVKLTPPGSRRRARR